MTARAQEATSARARASVSRPRHRAQVLPDGAMALA